MAFLNVLNVLSSAFALYLFIVVLRMKTKEPAHVLLSLAALALFIWNTLAYFVYNAGRLEVVRALLPISCVPMYFFFPLLFHFAYALNRRRSPAPLILVALYAPAVAFGVLSFFIPVSLAPIVAADGTIALEVPVGTIPTTLWSLYAVGCWVATLILAVHRFRKTTLNRERRQGAILIQWQIINLILVVAEFYATALIPGWTIPSQSPLLMSVWVGAVVYAMWKYGFLRISPRLLAEGILDSIEDIVVLYDISGNRVYVNRKAASILGVSRTAPFAALHDRGDPFAESVATLLSRVANWSSDEPERRFRINLAGDESVAQPLAAVVRAKPAFDRFDDPIGVAVVATVQPRLKDVLQAYRLTDREAEVLQYLAAGLSIGSTARVLSITERTVKAHITSIYQKTGAVNRVELVNRVAGSSQLDES